MYLDNFILYIGLVLKISRFDVKIFQNVDLQYILPFQNVDGDTVLILWFVIIAVLKWQFKNIIEGLQICLDVKLLINS